MDAAWISKDFQRVDKTDNIGKILGWMRGESKTPIIIFDGKKPYAVPNVRRFMTHAPHHETRAAKVAQPVHAIDPEEPHSDAVNAFAESLSPYLPTWDGREAGVVWARSLIGEFGEALSAGDAAHAMAEVGPDDPISHVLKALRDSPIPAMPVLEGGRVVGVVNRETLGRLQDETDSAPGAFDRMEKPVDLWDKPVRGYMRGAWFEIDASADAADVRERLQDADYAFVTQGGQCKGILTPVLWLRAAMRRSADDPSIRPPTPEPRSPARRERGLQTPRSRHMQNSPAPRR